MSLYNEGVDVMTHISETLQNNEKKEFSTTPDLSYDDLTLTPMFTSTNCTTLASVLTMNLILSLPTVDPYVNSVSH